MGKPAGYAAGSWARNQQRRRHPRGDAGVGSIGLPRTERSLLVDRGHATTVLRPAGLVGVGADRALLAVGDRADARLVDAQRGQVVRHRVGATLAEREVVLAGAALVAMTFDGDG